MKIRQGFVSNSSSSSFMVAFTYEGALTRENLYSLLGVSIGTPAEKVLAPMVDQIISAKELDTDEYLDDHGYGSLDEMEENDPDNRILKLLKEGWKLREFRVDNDEAGVWYRIGNIDLPAMKFFGEYY